MPSGSSAPFWCNLPPSGSTIRACSRRFPRSAPPPAASPWWNASGTRCGHRRACPAGRARGPPPSAQESPSILGRCRAARGQGCAPRLAPPGPVRRTPVPAAIGDAGRPSDPVVDQTGKFVEPVGVHDPAFRALLTLLETGRTYVKLSAPYEVSRTGPPHYDDVSVLARELVRAFPDRMLWASNWPHTVFPPDRKPSDGALLDLSPTGRPTGHCSTGSSWRTRRALLRLRDATHPIAC